MACGSGWLLSPHHTATYVHAADAATPVMLVEGAVRSLLMLSLLPGWAKPPQPDTVRATAVTTVEDAVVSACMACQHAGPSSAMAVQQVFPGLNAGWPVMSFSMQARLRPRAKAWL